MNPFQNTKMSITETILRFRAEELRTLLKFGGRNYHLTGTAKPELQRRCLEMVMMVNGDEAGRLRQKISEMVSSANVSRRRLSVTQPVIRLRGQAKAPPRVPVKPVQPGDGKVPVMQVNADEKKLPVKPLQFCEERAALVGPVDLETRYQGVKECRFEFTLTPDQVKELQTPERQVRVRFWAKNFQEHEDDFFPPVGLILKVNGLVVPSPPRPPILLDSNTGMARKPTSKPKLFDIKQSILASTETSIKIELEWLQEQISDYVMSISIVKVRSVEELLGIVKKNKQPIEVTKEVVRKMLKGSEDDIAVVCAPKNVRVPVTCPIGMKRIKFPCRGKSCKHPQCFDARTFLEMNELRPTFKCPLCKDFLSVSNLYIDEYFDVVLCILETMTSLANVEDIEIKIDGNWNPVLDMKNPAKPSSCPPTKRPKNDNCQKEDIDPPPPPLLPPPAPLPVPSLPPGLSINFLKNHPPPSITGPRIPHVGHAPAKPFYGVSGLYAPSLGFSRSNPTPLTPTFQPQRMRLDLSGYPPSYEPYMPPMLQHTQMQGWQPNPNYGVAFQNNGFGPRFLTNQGLGMDRYPPIPLPTSIPACPWTPRNLSTGRPPVSQAPVSSKPKPQPHIVDLIDSDEEIPQ